MKIYYKIFKYLFVKQIRLFLDFLEKLTSRLQMILIAMSNKQHIFEKLHFNKVI